MSFLNSDLHLLKYCINCDGLLLYILLVRLGGMLTQVVARKQPTKARGRIHFHILK